MKKIGKKIRWEKYDQFMVHKLPKFCPIFAPYFSHPVFQVSVVKTRILYILYLQNRYLIIITYLLRIASPFFLSHVEKMHGNFLCHKLVLFCPIYVPCFAQNFPINFRSMISQHDAMLCCMELGRKIRKIYCNPHLYLL